MRAQVSVGLASIWFLMLLWSPGGAWAQRLSEQQYQKLKNDILVVHQAEFASAVAASDFGTIAVAYNQVQVSDFYVWKTSLRRKEIYESKVVDAPPTQTTWSWATYKAQSVQERDAWVEMMRDGVINPSLEQTRSNYNVIFGGQGASLQQQNFLLAVSRRKALRGETLFADLTAGNGAASVPALLTFEGQIRYEDVYIALTQTP